MAKSCFLVNIGWFLCNTFQLRFWIWIHKDALEAPKIVQSKYRKFIFNNVTWDFQIVME
jgi:hypothetical protein